MGCHKRKINDLKRWAFSHRLAHLRGMHHACPCICHGPTVVLDHYERRAR